MAKIGRNAPCPCGSGKKYKRCHGNPVTQQLLNSEAVELARKRAEAEVVQRVRQQGHGNPIISTEVSGRRVVAVKNRLLQSTKWKTFHDFLLDYLKSALGPAWGQTELAKPLEQRHPILQWYDKLCHYQRVFIKEPGKVHSGTMTGAVGAFLHLAYDLYSLDHNAELQEKLLKRLRNPDNFSGALYEVRVAAWFARAGFDISFEDESDRGSSHCEFTATHKGTGKKYSVEAKRREGERFRVGRLFNDAQKKHANHERITFIDLNVRHKASKDERPDFMDKAKLRIKRFEGTTLDGQVRPPSFVVLTNSPFELYEDEVIPPSELLIFDFQIPDFWQPTYPSLRDGLNAREKYSELYDLTQSIQDHSTIPSTFDGDLPEYAFGQAEHRLLVGGTYLMPNEAGEHEPAVLESAAVMETEKLVYCSVRFGNRRRSIVTVGLSDAEIAAWKRHPDTFFGEVGQRRTHSRNIVELYDFFHDSVKNTSKEKLLESMKGHRDFEHLMTLSQKELASIKAERLALSGWAETRGARKENKKGEKK